MMLVLVLLSSRNKTVLTSARPTSVVVVLVLQSIKTVRNACMCRVVWYCRVLWRRCCQVRAVAVQLMEVVYGVKDNEWLVKLLRGMISGPGAGDKQKKVFILCICNHHRLDSG